MLHIALCSPDPGERAALLAQMAEAASALSIACRADCFSSGDELVKRWREGAKYGLVLLEIPAEGDCGLQTALALRALEPAVEIAFLAISRDCAFRAIEMDALHYLIKPARAEDFSEMFRRLLRRDGVKRYLTLCADGREYRIALDRIRRLFSRNKGTSIDLADGAVWLPSPFWQTASQLADEPEFVLLSRGCIGNLDHVRCLDYDVCRFLDNVEIAVSRRERLRVRTKYGDYLARLLSKNDRGSPRQAPCGAEPARRGIQPPPRRTGPGSAAKRPEP